MGLLADAVIATDNGAGPRCTVETLLERLPKDIASDLAMLLGHHPYTVIAQELEKLGWRVAADTLSRHHRGRCRCQR